MLGQHTLICLKHAEQGRQKESWRKLIKAKQRLLKFYTMKILIKFTSKIKAFLAKLYATTGKQNNKRETGKTWTSVEGTEWEKITNNH